MVNGVGWRVVSASIAGSSHEGDGRPCQDDHRVAVVQTPTEGDILVAAVADGAGSSMLSDQGSRLACEAALEAVTGYLAGGGAVSSIGEEQLHRWFDVCSTRLADRAAVLNVPPRQLACTLLLAIVGSKRACFAQLGDGAIVANLSGQLEAVFWPQNGEFANTTMFLTNPADRAELMIRVHDGTVSDIALLSDGLQLLALHYATQQAHAPFFIPMLDHLRNTAPDRASELKPPLEDFLSSEQIRARTDDDVTLVLATCGVPAPSSAP